MDIQNRSLLGFIFPLSIHEKAQKDLKDAAGECEARDGMWARMGVRGRVPFLARRVPHPKRRAFATFRMGVHNSTPLGTFELARRPPTTEGSC